MTVIYKFAVLAGSLPTSKKFYFASNEDTLKQRSKAVLLATGQDVSKSWIKLPRQMEGYKAAEWMTANKHGVANWIGRDPFNPTNSRKVAARKMAGPKKAVAKTPRKSPQKKAAKVVDAIVGATPADAMPADDVAAVS